MNTNFLDEPKTVPATIRRPLTRLADDAMREGAGQSATTLLGRVLRETGRKSIEVAAFGSTI